MTSVHGDEGTTGGMHLLPEVDRVMVTAVHCSNGSWESGVTTVHCSNGSWQCGVTTVHCSNGNVV